MSERSKREEGPKSPWRAIPARTHKVPRSCRRALAFPEGTVDIMLLGSRSSSERSTIMALIETEEAARRLARAIASDLSLYNVEKVEKGITNDNLFDVLAEEIEEGRALYKRRVAPELYRKNFYERALVDILIKAKGHIKSKVW